jgi:hypothetical protein
MKLNVAGALIMLILEYFVLLRLYTRSKSLQVISLIVAPLMVLVASGLVQSGDPVKLFLVFVAMEIPLSLIGYKLTPDASLLARVAVAASFGVTSSLVGRAVTL